MNRSGLEVRFEDKDLINLFQDALSASSRYLLKIFFKLNI